MFSEFSKRFPPKTLGAIGKWATGSTPSKKNKEFWQNGDILWVTPKDVKLEIINDTIDKVTKLAINESKLNLFSKDLFVVVWRSGILQHSLPVTKIVENFTINQDMKVFIPNRDCVRSEYVRAFLKTFSENVRQKSVKSGTTVQSINSNVFSKYKIPIPPISDQENLMEVELLFETSIEKTNYSLLVAKKLKKSIIDTIF